MSVNNGNSLTYKLLPAEEWERLRPLFKQFDWFLPPPMLASAAIAENGNREIVGFQVLQAVLHAEPGFIDPRYSGIVSYMRMWEMLDKLPNKKGNPLIVPGYLLVAPDEKIKRMAEIGGFKEIEGVLMKKEW